MRQHKLEVGDLVYWTMGEGIPLPFEGSDLFIGIVTNISEVYAGVEVYWFNNQLFRVLNYQELIKADMKKYK